VPSFFQLMLHGALILLLAILFVVYLTAVCSVKWTQVCRTTTYLVWYTHISGL